jgi:hypothetical protein
MRGSPPAAKRLESYIAYWSALQAYEEALRAIAETPVNSQIDSQLFERASDKRQDLKTATARVRLISSPPVLQALNQAIHDRGGLRKVALNRETSRFAPGQLGIENSKLMDLCE